MKMNQLNPTDHLQRLRSRYAARGKQGKSRLLDELCEHYGYSRKHAIKLLAHPLPPLSDHKPSGAPPRNSAANGSSTPCRCGCRITPNTSSR